ncbi:hypothetical protein [Arthrobacter sp. UYCu712]|uniref:hypothetical protein n=1 Tax=Arthrobacter sp. UYCu712 TaxID=3156340 RepID=UPI00339A8EBE
MSTDPRVEAVARVIGAYGTSEKVSAEFMGYATEALAAADAVDPLRRPGHVLEIRPTSYGIQHPPECRPHLLDCPLEMLMSEEEKAPALPGRYPAEVIDAELVLGPRIEES